jgi:hypothetical protein
MPFYCSFADSIVMLAFHRRSLLLKFNSEFDCVTQLSLVIVFIHDRYVGLQGKLVGQNCLIKFKKLDHFV